MFDTLSNIDSNFIAAVNNVNDWGKQYWGFILVVFAVSYFLTNIVYNTRIARRKAAERRLDRLRQLAMGGRSYANNFVPRTNLSNVLKRSTDMDMVNAMDQARISRLNNMKGNASGDQW